VHKSWGAVGYLFQSKVKERTGKEEKQTFDRKKTLRFVHEPFKGVTKGRVI